MKYRADAALFGGRVEPDVLIDIAADGTIVSVTPRATEVAERLSGLVVPGMPNLHSHAFQRAMAGLAERAGPTGDDFWRWREVMYRFLAILTPDDVQAIAAQLYVECLLHGYTSVAEFHYLHNTPDGSRYEDKAELSHRVKAAACEAGIGLTLLPVLYRHSQFGGAEPTEGQRRFILTLDDYADLCAAVGDGVAPHSLRAVTPDELTAAIAIAGGKPIHIHVAEQQKEVADCVAWSGAPPVAWLLDHAEVDQRWCLIHATHIDPAERARLAGSGAIAGLCQTTEANLGDGIFPLRDFLADGGRFGIGTDSNVSTSPVEELRWLEYIRRLETRSRNVTTDLYTRALAGGAQALGRRGGSIEPGRHADLVVLDAEHSSLVGRAGDALIDAWLFSGNTTPVRDVMACGEWVVRDAMHRAQPKIAAAFARTMRRLAGVL
ncbi:MAG TPA: formimidoylglutamate deiminase [Acetobacteraceae bacterium]|jgi:formimidoylglutamate deiminase|nr:formimidoylglutamate deiminase [Acetobacteraceae bacterium]